MTQKYTIEDIAQRAGVGRTTVSRVLNNQPYVSQVTRDKVLAVIEELNYHPNYSARQMRTRSSGLIGFVTDDIVTSPYAVDIITGAREAAWEQQKILLVVSAGLSIQAGEDAIAALLERQVEGIVYAAMYHRQVIVPSNTRNISVVLANSYVADRSLPSVVPDEFGGGRTATEILLQKGHRRIGFINLDEPAVDASRGRLEGYKAALAAYRIPYKEALVMYQDYRPHASFHITKHLMNLTDPPTAIFCGNDRIAMGCYAALSDLDLRIPHDVAVIGFDNQRDIADGLWPPLTTMQLPHYEMGKWAVEYLLHPDSRLERPRIQHRLACPLVERASV